ncbi:sigma-70 family RNA polymerase sigma factor [Neorhodopirellula lusitana]|uniref:sigma-70 family RNA polymerase sigma factor n=1 Tax=Neorhodopirellula lusitana TaxID=445327 RepID=UPI00384D2F46
MFVQNSPLIRGFILSLLPNMSRADDVLQETFLTISAKADEFVPDTDFASWACTIARYKVLEEFRASGAKSTSVLSPDVVEALCSVHTPPSNDIEGERLAALTSCLESLMPSTRRAIELRYCRAHSAAEIASILGWTTDSVYVMLSRARVALEKCIGSRLKTNGA